MTAPKILTEIWRPVDGWPYEVSSLGRVRRSGPRKTNSKPGVPLKQGRSHGYAVVTMSFGARRRTARVHHLVARAFIGPRPAGMVVNHLDGNKLNNHPGNLEYCTNQENTRHAAAMGLRPFGERHWCARLTVADIHEIDRLGAEGVSMAEIAAKFGINRWTVSRIWRRKVWAHVVPMVRAKRMGRRPVPGFCLKGHELTAENTYVSPSTGIRTCRICQLDRQRRRIARLRCTEKS